jgi:hypothetical protein
MPRFKMCPHLLARGVYSLSLSRSLSLSLSLSLCVCVCSFWGWNELHKENKRDRKVPLIYWEEHEDGALRMESSRAIRLVELQIIPHICKSCLGADWLLACRSTIVREYRATMFGCLCGRTWEPGWADAKSRLELSWWWLFYKFCLLPVVSGWCTGRRWRIQWTAWGFASASN